MCAARAVAASLYCLPSTQVLRLGSMVSPYHGAFAAGVTGVTAAGTAAKAAALPTAAGVTAAGVAGLLVRTVAALSAIGGLLVELKIRVLLDPQKHIAPPRSIGSGIRVGHARHGTHDEPLLVYAAILFQVVPDDGRIAVTLVVRSQEEACIRLVTSQQPGLDVLEIHAAAAAGGAAAAPAWEACARFNAALDRPGACSATA